MKRRLTTLILLAFVLAVGPGNRGCGERKDETPEQAAERNVGYVVSGLSVAAQGIEAGIPTVRAFREAGKLEPGQSLELARNAKRANQIMRKVADYLLTHDRLAEGDRKTLLDDISELLDLARDIEGVRPKGGDAQLVFDLGLIAGKSGLQIAVNEFGDALPAGFSFPVTPAQRRKLESAKEVMRRNATALDEAIERLSAGAAR